MGRETVYFKNGHISLTTPDAKFNHKGKSVVMSFYPYLGPLFKIVDGNDLIEFSPGEEKEYDNLWKQFYGWFEAKGKAIYEIHGL